MLGQGDGSVNIKLGKVVVVRLSEMLSLSLSTSHHSGPSCGKVVSFNRTGCSGGHWCYIPKLPHYSGLILAMTIMLIQTDISTVLSPFIGLTPRT